MSLRRCDRYLLRQMLGPFFLALAGLALFILLNLILNLSELIADRGVGIGQLLRLLLLWMPELITWAIPMAALFATFLGLGRLEHDREIMALESIGVSLRRILLPILIAAVGISFVTFAVYNWAMPASKQAAQQTYREILFTQSVPRVSANTFFTGPNDQKFYARQYNADDGSVRDVLIYDVSGRLYPQAEARVTILTADSGTWVGEDWELSSGRVYGFDRENTLIYSGTFEKLTIPVAQTVDQLWSQSKSTSEMTIRELIARIAQAQASGLPTSASIVELHQRFALPLSAILYVLVAGVVSLMFGSKNRSTGIIIGLLIIGLYQGAYFWMQALGRRAVINPVLATWIPNLVFGLIGVLLFLLVDRLASRDVWNRLRNRLPFLTSFLLLASIGVICMGQDVPLHLECDDLFISEDRSEITAQGSVYAELEDAVLQADSLYLKQDETGQWTLEADGDLTLTFGEFNLSGDSIVAKVRVSNSGARMLSMESVGFRGQSAFTNSAGEEHTLHFLGETGRMEFDDAGEVSLIEIHDGEVTTCNCCDRPFQSQPYTIRASRLLYYPDRMIVAFGLTGRIAGVSTLWLPVYVQPLEETLESPLFPAFGSSALRGWFLKWSVPFYLSESLYGSVLLDYYSKHDELGTGLITRYAFADHKGQFRVYSFPAKVGDSIFEFSARHELPTTGIWDGSGNIDYRVVGGTTELDYGAQANGSSNEWTVNVSAAREVEERNTDDDDEANDITKITERFPEISMSRNPWNAGFLSIQPRFELGQYREQLEGDPSIEATRLSGGLHLSTQPLAWQDLHISPRLNLQATAYIGNQLRETQGSLHASMGAQWRDLNVTYDLQLVQGSSPFEFDAEVATHHIGLSFTRDGWATLDLSTGFDLTTNTPDPVQADLGWTLWVNWSLSADYSLVDATLDSIQLSGNWTSQVLQLAWAIPYDPPKAKFGTITLSADMPGEWIELEADAKLRNGVLTVQTDVETTLTLGPVDTQGSIRFDNLSLDRVVLAGQYVSDAGWGGKLRWTYSGGPLSFDSVLYGVFWDIGECLRIGIDREASDTWLYISILAFPEAILRYAPERASIQIGD